MKFKKGVASTRHSTHILNLMSMDTTSFEDFSSALVFLKEMKVGVVSRSPAGDTFQWSAGHSQLDERQRFLLNTQRGDDATWMDEETGLMWLFDKTPRVIGVTFPRSLRFAGHDDWRTPTVNDLKTLRGAAKNECGAYVKPTVPARLTGAYSCSTAIRKGSQDDGMTWNYTTNSFGAVQYTEGKIKWGSNGGFAGFDKDSTSGEGASIYVRGARSDKMDDWFESQICWAEENDYHNYPVTPETILALETLRLDDDKFPPYLCKLQNLQKIVVSRCATLPQELFQLQQLAELHWCNDSFNSGAQHCLLPAEVGTLSSLTSLILKGVNISKLPQSIGELKNLKKLHVMRTKVGFIPESVGLLRNLEELALTHNGLTALPASVADLKGLLHLTVSDRKLTDISDGFSCLARLESLILDWTPVGALSERVADLKHLKELSVKKCGLSALPTRLLEIKGLKSLNISFNRIDVLPLSLGDLIELESLDTSATLVHELPDSLRELNKLRHLNVSGTPLTTLPDWIGTMVSLTNIVAAKLWHIKKLPQFEGKRIGTYALNQPDEEEWLMSLGWPGKRPG